MLPSSALYWLKLITTEVEITSSVLESGPEFEDTNKYHPSFFVMLKMATIILVKYAQVLRVLVKI